ncbi:MAG TPA: SDR family NAD(P)-dependent oxidoreductase [Microbacteriaceae bacterium]|nr:SDR family NAD(P)-dependent oxidoreductase [Microbacteriaceae bacterium]
MSDGTRRRPLVVVTGASSGIGRLAARKLAEAGARVALVGRDPRRTSEAALEAGGTPFVADFDRLGDVRRLAQQLDELGPIDVLVNNAGGLVQHRELTVDGNERIFQANHLAPFLLTNLLLAARHRRGDHRPFRVVSTASSAHRYGRLDLHDLTFARRPWRAGWAAYGAAKLATVLFVRELARRAAADGLAGEVTAFAVHPGLVATGFVRDIPWLRLVARLTGGHYALGVEAGAAPLVRLARQTPGALSGSYFDRMRAGRGLAARARGPAADRLARELWRVSARLTGLDER